ncbi:MAG: PD40 domain-containing protein [Cyclobacteriaceae bacterium]|nr:PD40 domain-containing protein [Cyclobacteriaceae bacterium]
MKYLFLFILFFSAALKIDAQELQFSQPVRLGTAVNSDDEELAPMLAPDGQTLYFSRAFHDKNIGGKYSGTDIWISTKDSNGNWTPAVNAGKPWNNKRSNAVIGISADGSTVYLSNAYNNKSGISFSKLVMGKWTKPELIAVPGINRDDFVSVYVHPSFDVVMISMKGKGSYGEEDLYVSLRDSVGNWSQPKNLGPSINTSGFENSPFLSIDKAKLFFSSNGHGGYGDADILVSERMYGTWDIWSVPRNLGESVNSSGFDGYFSIYADTIAYCARDLSKRGLNLYGFQVSYVINVLPSETRFLTDEELSEIFPKRISTRLDYNSGITSLTADQTEIIWFLANRILTRKDVSVLIWVREEEDSRSTLERRADILRALRLVGFDESRVSFSTDRIKPEVSKSGGGVIELLLFK